MISFSRAEGPWGVPRDLNAREPIIKVRAPVTTGKSWIRDQPGEENMQKTIKTKNEKTSFSESKIRSTKRKVTYREVPSAVGYAKRGYVAMLKLRTARMVPDAPPAIKLAKLPFYKHLLD